MTAAAPSVLDCTTVPVPVDHGDPASGGIETAGTAAETIMPITASTGMPTTKLHAIVSSGSRDSSAGGSGGVKCESASSSASASGDSGQSGSVRPGQARARISPLTTANQPSGWAAHSRHARASSSSSSGVARPPSTACCASARSGKAAARPAALAPTGIFDDP